MRDVQDDELPRETKALDAVNRSRVARGDTPIERTPPFKARYRPETLAEMERIADETITGPSVLARSEVVDEHRDDADLASLYALDPETHSADA